jgi:hypothetical protein
LPAHAALTTRTTEIMKAPTPRWGGLRWRGGQLFAIEARPPRQQSFLVVRKSADSPVGEERVLFDPASIDPDHHTAIDWYEPSLDGNV